MNRKTFLFLTLIVAILALLDIKYKGLFYRQLPASIQDRLNG